MPGPTTRRGTAVLAALAAYVLLAGTADLINPGWSPVETMVSHYVHAPAGWLIPAALFSLGTAAALLRKPLTASGSSRAGRRLLAAFTAAVLTGALFPADPPGRWDQPPTVSGIVHGTAALIAFSALPAAAIVLTRTWRRDRRWQPVARPLTVTAALCTVTCAALAVLFADVTDGPSLTAGPWESLVGLAERLALWSYVAWLAVAAWGLRRLTARPAAAGRRDERVTR
ncbi:DUF998 domain-containing protein [Actinoplanes sp. NPDC023801]|uniref:DUF998 domain-containing protein n=1 Tax=Actinoplanes sp. NPDC023801 TaxID=3154595 RepID=UPI0033FA6064